MVSYVLDRVTLIRFAHAAAWPPPPWSSIEGPTGRRPAHAYATPAMGDRGFSQLSRSQWGTFL